MFDCCLLEPKFQKGLRNTFGTLRIFFFQLLYQDKDVVLLTLYDASLDVEQFLFGFGGLHADSAFGEAGDDGGVVLHDFKQSAGSRQLDEGCLSFE